ncbi:MAG: phytoene/squalene synthase family protein [Cyclobacteriaceae bacterium]|nr:phytoene/squalene synthase family protein [Cyclobacteriaceae bacterium]
MNQKQLFDQVSLRCSKLTTRAYSTSFSLGISCLERSLRNPIYSIYGFVRLADEIVDTFHEFDKASLLQRFREETYRSIDEGISLNPILNSFQHTVRTYKIDRDTIEQFLHSMEMDLAPHAYSRELFEEYILGSAEVVGLMCLRVFCKGDEPSYQRMKPYAMKLGAAFQKINFLRDLKADNEGLGRMYFPGIDFNNFDAEAKAQIEAEIEKDFHEGYIGIKMLPRGARFGVYVAYVYYLALFKKIRSLSSHHVAAARIRIDNKQKLSLLALSFVKHQFNML